MLWGLHKPINLDSKAGTDFGTLRAGWAPGCCGSATHARLLTTVSRNIAIANLDSPLHPPLIWLMITLACCCSDEMRVTSIPHG